MKQAASQSQVGHVLGYILGTLECGAKAEISIRSLNVEEVAPDPAPAAYLYQVTVPSPFLPKMGGFISVKIKRRKKFWARAALLFLCRVGRDQISYLTIVRISTSLQ